MGDNLSPLSNKNTENMNVTVPGHAHLYRNFQSSILSGQAFHPDPPVLIVSPITEPPPQASNPAQPESIDVRKK